MPTLEKPVDIVVPSFEAACDILGIKPDDVFEKAGVPSDRQINDALRDVEVLGTSVGIMRGCGFAELRDEDGLLKDLVPFANLITNKGDQYYVERAAGGGTPPGQVTGMQLGTGTTAPNKATQAGLSIGTLIASSLVAIDGGFPTFSALQTNNTAHRVTWKTTWPAGTATNAAIAEVALVNQATGTQTVAPASATISRALVSPTINKAAADSLAITWNHDLLGA